MSAPRPILTALLTILISLLILLWALSGRWYCWWVGSSMAANLNSGQFTILWLGPASGVPPGWTLQRSPLLDFWPRLPSAGPVSGTPGACFLSVPLWLLAAPLLALAVYSLRRDRRLGRARLRNHCPACLYDRAGLAPVAPCPECGRPPSSLTAPPP